jgi:glutathione S-transferase
VLWLLEELGVPFDLTVISRETKQTPEYLALHPLGRSPAFEEEEGPVFESTAILLHLADKHLAAGLVAPLGSHERALQYQWCFFGMTEIESALVDIARQLSKESGEPHADVVDHATARFVAAAGVIEVALGGGDYLVEDAFSVADIVVGSVLGYSRRAELSELPAGVTPYVDGLQARPAYGRALAIST